MNEGHVTVVGAIAIGAAILAALIGAVLGGFAAMRFHRKVDRTGLEPPGFGPVTDTIPSISRNHEPTKPSREVEKDEHR